MLSNIEMIITICTVLFILSCFIPQGACCPALPTAIGNMTPDYDLLVGKELVINCNLYNNIIKHKDVTSYVNSSSLILKFFDKEITENVRIIDDLTIQLRIQNATVENTGNYFCYLKVPQTTKKKLICTGKVAVGYSPREVENFTCSSLQLDTLRCYWKPPPNEVNTEYILYDNLNYKNRCTFQEEVKLKRKCPSYVHNEKNSCEWASGNPVPYIKTRKKLCLFLEGNNSLGSIVQHFAIDHYSIVVPGKPKEFNIQNHTTNSLMAFWLAPNNMGTKEEFPPGLVYELQYKPRYSNKWQTITLENETHINITNLIPHTDYNLKLRCRSRDAASSEEMWSENATESVRTYPDNPYLAPEITPGLFETRHLGSNWNITLHWKRIPEEYWNGEEFKYVIRYDETHIRKQKRSVKQQRNITHEKSFAVFVGMDLNRAYEFLLYSANQKGLSRNYSTIKVPRKKDMPQTPRDIKAIYHDGNYSILWESPNDDKDPIESYTVFWCKVLQPSLFPCNGPIKWKSVSASVNTVSLPLSNENAYLRFAVSANTNYSSSGLEWAPCVVPINGVLNKMNKVSLQSLNSTTLKVIWYLDCPVHKHLVQAYKISYCKVKHDQGICLDEVKNVTITDKQANSCFLEELDPSSLYKVVTFVITEAGSSEESDPRFERTKDGAPSDSPQNFSVLNKTDTTVELTWQPPLKQNGAIDSYKLNIRRDNYGFQKSIDIEVRHNNIKLEQLIPYTNYTFELMACVGYECSPPSVMSTITGISVPGPMEGPVPRVHNETFVQISWLPPSESNGPIDFYTLYIQWESEDEPQINAINVSGLSYDVTLTCPADDKVMLYFFSIQAANVRDGEVLYGNRSGSVESRLCLSNKGMELGVIIGISVGAAAVLACVIITLYFFARWMKKKVDTIKDIKVQLPLGLETAQGNPLNSYENFKNGLVRKPSDSYLSPKTFYGRLNSYASDESDSKDRNDSAMSPFGNNSQEALIHKMKDHSDGKANNDDANIGKGHDSISSSLTTRTQLSSDSGAETDVQAPPSPESDVPLGLPHTSPQHNKSSLPKVNEAHSCDSKDSGLEKEGGSEKESDVSDPNQYSKFVRYLDNPNHPYNRRQVSDKGTVSQQLPYSKFGVNMPGISGYVPLSSTLALMHRSLANSEPSVVDAETVNKSNPDLEAAAIAPAPPYSKYGIGRSLGQSLNVPHSNESDSLGTGYSKCGVGPDISWLQQPRSPYIAANLASVLLGSDTSKENKQLNPLPNNIDLTGHSKKTVLPLPPSPSCSSHPRSKGYVTVESMNKPSSFSPSQQINGPAYYCLDAKDKKPLSKGYVSVQDAKNMLSEDRKLPQLSESKDQQTGIPGYSKFDIQCDRLQNTSNIQTLDPVLTGTKPKTYPNSVHQGYVPYHNPSFDMSSVNLPYNSNNHTVNGNLNGDLSPLSADLDLENESSEFELDTGSNSPSKYLPQSRGCKPASELSNGYVTVNADSSIDTIRIVPTDNQIRPSLTDTAV